MISAHAYAMEELAALRPDDKPKLREVPPDDLIEIHVAAVLADRSKKTIRRWCKLGMLRRWKRLGRLLVSRHELVTILEPCEIRSNHNLPK